MWYAWAVISLGWSAIWIEFGTKYTSSKQGDELVGAWGGILLGFAAATVAVTCLAGGRHSVASVLALWIHHASTWALLAFLLVAEALQREACWRIRGGETATDVAATYRRLWILTRIVPAPIAVTIFLTGLRLIWQSPERNSPREMWLFCLVIAFGFFFFDGIWGYTPIVANAYEGWRRAAENNLPVAFASVRYMRQWERVQLSAHVISWPIVFLLGVFQWRPVTPMVGCVTTLEQRLSGLPEGWPQVTIAVAVWALVGLFVRAIRHIQCRLTRA